MTLRKVLQVKEEMPRTTTTTANTRCSIFWHIKRVSYITDVVNRALEHFLVNLEELDLDASRSGNGTIPRISVL